MNFNIKKLDGTVEPFDLGKILRWSSWAASGCTDISLEDVVQSAASSLYEGITTQEITIALCKSCEDLSKIAADNKEYNLVQQYFDISRNLYIPSVIKRVNYFQDNNLTDNDIYSSSYIISPDNQIPLKRFKLKSILTLGVNLGVYDSNLLDGTFSDEFFEYADSILNYANMEFLNFNGLRQLEEKYLLKYEKDIIEDPQQHFMLISLALVHSDSKIYPNGQCIDFQKDSLLNYYIIQAQSEANNPTPFSVGIRTPHKQYDSCCLFDIDDNNDSIEAGMMTSQKATVAGAGLGINLGRIRAKGTTYRKKGVHGGLLGYLGQITGTVKASNQVSRGGGATINWPMWHRDYYSHVMLKDITGIEGENRYRHLDYAFHYSNYMLRKLATNDRILLVSPNQVIPDGRTVYDAFYNTNEDGFYDDSAFIEYCESILNDPSIDLPYINSTNETTVKPGVMAYTTAYDLFSTFVNQVMSNGRLYTLNINNTNDHSSFRETIHMSNLCMEITQPTYPLDLKYSSKDHQFSPDFQSETSFCQLGGVVVGRITKEDLPRVCYWIARYQEAVFNISDYSKITFSHKQKKRRNIGIGIINLQHLLVKEVYSVYPEKEWIREAGRVTHEWSEAIQYYLLTASNKLAQELGACEYFGNTKYSKGILPIDTCVKTPLTDFPLLQDWTALRLLIKQHGLRFGTHTAEMPSESSSVTFSLINGMEFPRSPVTFKGNKKLLVAVPVPEIGKYGAKYVYAWDDYSFDINELYLSIAANLTKNIDQSISYNFYLNLAKGKVSESYLFKLLFINPSRAGIKTTYYINFNVDKSVENDEDTSNKTQEMTQEEKEFFEKLKLLEQESSCAGGSCTL